VVTDSAKNNTKLIQVALAHRIILRRQAGRRREVTIVDSTKKNKIVLDFGQQDRQLECDGEIRDQGQDQREHDHSNALKVGHEGTGIHAARTVAARHAQKTFVSGFAASRSAADNTTITFRTRRRPACRLGRRVSLAARPRRTQGSGTGAAGAAAVAVVVAAVRAGLRRGASGYAGAGASGLCGRRTTSGSGWRRHASGSGGAERAALRSRRE